MEVELPDLVAKVVYLTGWWEHAISRYVMGALKPGDIFIDVGANIGYYSLLAAKLVGTSGRVYAIEASPDIADRLERNIALNGFENVRVIRAAATDHRGTAQVFSGPSANKGATTVVESVAGNDYSSDFATVPAAPLDELVGTDLYSARMIKIDVEGAELSIISSLDIPRFSGETEWSMELMPWAYSPEAVLTPFRRLGYTVYKLANSYEPDFYLYPEKPHAIRALNSIPDKLTDVLISKRSDIR
jgi:FkbM family methyltransferase